MINYFERPASLEWIYPCTLDDVRAQLCRFPSDDLSGLWAVGLVPATRKHCDVYGTYFFGDKPRIHLYSHAIDLRFKLAPHTKRSDIEQSLAFELEYGMKVEPYGARFVCLWDPVDLRRFILQHVLAHEVGHHVFFWKRKLQGLEYTPHVAGAEAFAEDYAARNHHPVSG